MSDKITVKVKGIDEALKNLKWYQVVKREACGIALKRGAFDIERAAKEKCPVDYGRLRASITTNWAGSSMRRAKIKSPCRRQENPTKSEDGVGQPDGPKELVFVVGSNVTYAPYQEFGTKHMPPRHYLYPAYFMYEGEIVKDIGKVFKKDIRLK